MNHSPEPKTYQVGQKVKLFDVNGKRYGEPEDGKDGEIVKVGRKLLTIRNEYGSEKQYRIDDRVINDGYGHQWFMTPAQAEELARRRAAEAVIRPVFSSYTWERTVPLDVLETIAALLLESEKSK